MPAFVKDENLPFWVGGWALALIGIFNSIDNSSSQMYHGIFLTNIIGSLCLLLISLLIYGYLIKIGRDEL